MPQVEFTGQSAQDQGNIAANPSRLVNCYREPLVPGGRAGYTIKSVPGMELVAEFPGPIDAVAAVSRKVYVAAAGALYVLGDAGPEHLGAIPSGDGAMISGNNDHVTVTVGGQYVVWDGTALISPAHGAFSQYAAHEYIGNYTVLTEKDGRRFQWSNIADPTDLPGLNFSTADGRDDNLIRPVAINGALYLFKETSHEIWYSTGLAGASAFERQSGGVYDVGLLAHALICKVPGGAFFVGDDGRVHLVSGGVKPVSIPAVEVSIRKNSPKSCFLYEAFGHTFCAITFGDRAAWVYDLATGEWHERAEGANLGPWRACCTAKNGGVWYAGRGNGLYRFADVATDGPLPLVRELTSRTLVVDRRMIVVDLIEAFPRQGFEPQKLELEVSRDGGLTWTAPKAASIGPVGAYGQRVTWRGLGSARQFTARFRASESAGFAINAECEVVIR